MGLKKSLEEKRLEILALREQLAEIEARRLEDQQKAQEKLEHSQVDSELARLREILAQAKGEHAPVTTTTKQEG